MKFLHVGAYVGGRITSQSVALRALGHQSSLITPGYDLFSDWVKEVQHPWSLAPFFDEVFYTDNRAEVITICDGFDVIIAHGDKIMPGLDGVKKRIILDCNDIYRDKRQNAPIYRRADAFLFVTPLQRLHATEFWEEGPFANKPYWYAPNVPPEAWIVHEERHQTNDISVVFEGGVSEDASHHRYFLPWFRRLSNSPGIELHLYLPWHNQRYIADLPNAHFHPPERWDNIVREMSRYDLSFCVFKHSSDHPKSVEHSYAGKIGFAKAAGIPTLVEEHMVAAGPELRSVPWESHETINDSELIALLKETIAIKPVKPVRLEDYMRFVR